MNIYQENIKKYEVEIEKLTRVLGRVSMLRLIVFLISAILLITLFSYNQLILVFMFLPLLIFCFALVIKRYNKIDFLKKQKIFLKEINELEILRGDCLFDGFDPGERFENPDHPYLSDLDIFGSHSLFQLLNRTTTESGKILLSRWLSEPAKKSEILDRQEAIKELSPKLHWRQQFQAAGMPFQNKKRDYQKLLSWVEAPAILLNNKLKYQIGVVTLALLAVLSLFFVIINGSEGVGDGRFVISLVSLILVLLINGRVLKSVRNIADEMVENAQKNLDTFKGYQALLKKIENEKFTSKYLNGFKSILKKNKYSALKQIKSVSRLLEFSEQRGVKNKPIGGNQFYPVLNVFLLLDVHMIIAAEKWKSKNKESLKLWSVVVSEFEVVSSFAGLYYSNPSFTFPEIIEGENLLNFEAMGHPLINPEKRVCNNFSSGGNGNVIMVTGSNMGGKSTFLRTLGVNIVLALAGAPCCAKKAQVSNLKIFTSMRTQDNLKEGISSFFAELNRIKEMLRLIESRVPAFFVLDEMFKGTNSKDRHRGGFSLIKQISELNSLGIVATHDIGLAKLLGDRCLVDNFSFNSEIKNGSMIFNYKLEPGICSDFNASELMRKTGIKILDNF